MKVAVAQFPGSNCDQDALWSLRDDIDLESEYVWHDTTSLAGFDAVFVPGGFTYGDYLRCGAIASQSPLMSEIKKFASDGRPIIGVCNGFQILCEAGLLPGALLLNAGQKFVCRTIFLKAVDRTSIWTHGVDRVIEVPIAHGEGRFVCDADTLKLLKDRGQIAFEYVDATGRQTPESNPNGSESGIAGVLNQAKNVLGMMPHPERATRKALGSSDGQLILQGLNLVSAG